MKELRPELLLVLLLLAATAAAGWLYGLHWKRVAMGGQFSKTETLIIQLQDQLDLLHRENGTMAKRIVELENEKTENQQPANE